MMPCFELSSEIHHLGMLKKKKAARPVYGLLLQQIIIFYLSGRKLLPV